MSLPLPKLVTFDGHARSGKGTMVSMVKDYLRDECGHVVMFIDAGQVFRVLVVAATQARVNLDKPEEIDAFLEDQDTMIGCVQLVKDVYHMPKDEREALLYTPEIGVNSAKVGARPLSQVFKDQLLEKWLLDARSEGFDVVLLDGRALEEVGARLDAAGLCHYVLGLFFVCDPIVSAQRMLGRMPVSYDTLDSATKALVDESIEQIEARNTADQTRDVQPVVAPLDAPRYLASQIPLQLPSRSPCPMAIIDRSEELPRQTMALPLERMIARYVK